MWLTMTHTLLRNLFGAKATRRHPQVARPPLEGSRGELVNDIEACTLCGVCAAKCPSRCIEVDKGEGLWIQDPYACVACGVCSELCPAGSLRHRGEYRPPAEVKSTLQLQGRARREKHSP
ncbi:MAG: 4Fe-4S binding protein [Syntrophobacteraceae bacterium]|jgi:formate hydrogenlyase subunit 6/NADH:ubiquinone oxidoreductase subunit I|nr:4Fe-4S binding protein [Syntrophobacteraceae bacterium]